MATLAEIRAKLKQAEERKNNRDTRSTGDGLTFPFWDKSAAYGSTSVLRFLPDGNPDNTYFWRERQVIKLEFPGILGHDENKPVTIQVPCMEMYGETCPILTEIRPWFQGDAESEALARKYWKKRTYMFQGFVRESAVVEETVPENPIRKFVLGPQVFGIVKAALMDAEMENLPTDYLNGIDFRLTKDEKGGYADYSKSSYSRRESSLSEDELVAIEKYGLPDLGTYIPEKPTPEVVSVIFDMFSASVAGELYDPTRWAKYYKPYGLETTVEEAKPATKITTKPSVAAKAAPAEEAEEEQEPAPKAATSAVGSRSAEAILANIRARK